VKEIKFFKAAVLGIFFLFAVTVLTNGAEASDYPYPYYFDVNRDGVVNVVDASVIIIHFGEKVSGEDMADGIYPNYDINRDGLVNTVDMSFIVIHWGEKVDPVFYLEGDVNRDGIVDREDTRIVGKHFGEVVSESDKRARLYPSYDVNEDGKINIVDVAATVLNWGESLVKIQ
jgi:Ca2+-binding EF-hand superfamily protein